MKTITIFGPTIVDGAVRYPHENPLTVSDREAKRLNDAGVLADDVQDDEQSAIIEPATGD